jgi:hypothetical protein
VLHNCLDIQKDIQMVKQNVWLLKIRMLYLSIIKNKGYGNKNKYRNSKHVK